MPGACAELGILTEKGSNWLLVSRLHLHFHLFAAFREHVNITLIGEGIVPAFPGADTDNVINGINEDQSVADAAGLCSLPDGLDRSFHIVIAEDDIELNTRQEVHSIGPGPPSQLDPTLASMSAYLAHVHADDADLIQSFLHPVKFFLAEDGFDFLGHAISPFVWFRHMPVRHAR